MTYSVKEMYYTLQGEGARAGRAAVFLRFAGCNLWSGREQDRERAICRFCDTDFVGTDGRGGGKFRTAEQLATAVNATWTGTTDPATWTGTNATWTGTADAATWTGTADADATWTGTPEGKRYVVCTGGEPLLQLDTAAIAALHNAGFEIAIESNGTIAAPPGIDWICVSPKAGARIVQTEGDELKLVYPQIEKEAQPENFTQLSFRNFYLQPMDCVERAENTQAAIEYCLQHPQWKLSLQTHKITGID